MLLRRFNIRVYGLLLNENNQILVSDELIKGQSTTKFPGGGVELGEGLRDALVREFKEECNVTVQVGEHFYTTDFFAASAFDSESQVISIYYICSSLEWQLIKTSSKKFDFPERRVADMESFRWVNMTDLHHETDVNLIIDKVVVKMLTEKYPKVGFRIPHEE